jgi:hypothetical protein
MSDKDENTRDYARRPEMNRTSATDALLKELADAKEAGWKIGHDARQPPRIVGCQAADASPR